MSQTHSKFKTFISPPSTDGHLPAAISEAVRNFVLEKGVAAKSVGVEYVEEKDQLVLSLGYRDDEPGYPVTVKSVALGRLDFVPEIIEQAMGKAAEAAENVICHEFYVKSQGEFFLVLMSQG